MPAKRRCPFSWSLSAAFFGGVGQGEAALGGSDSKVNMEAMLTGPPSVSLSALF